MITLNYQIALTNVPFDNSYKNVMRFDTRSEQETFFNVSSLFSSDTPKVNFNVGSLMATNIVFDCDKTDDINELLNKNYCIVKDNSSNAGLDYYYYFITNAKQENENRISLSIELDIFQTYYIDLKFSDCLIERAHLDRWLDNLDGTVSFNGNVDSPLFEREGFDNIAKRLVKRTILSQYPDNTLGNWFKEHVKAWCYVFCDPTNGKASAPNTSPTGYKYISASTNADTLNYKPTRTFRNVGKVINIPSNMTCFCFPIYKNDNSTIMFTGATFDSTPIGGMSPKYYWGNSYDPKTNGKVLLNFYNTPENGPFVYSVKISDTPPFKTFNNLTEGTDYTISTSGKTLTLNTSVLTGRINNLLINTTDFSNDTMIFGEEQGSTEHQFYCMTSIGEFPNNITTDYSLGDIFKFNITSIMMSNKDSKYNPKLLSLDFKSLKISDSSENGFDFDIQKINQKDFKITKYEPLVPDLTKKYITLGNLNGIYNNNTHEALYGYLATNDTSIPILHSAYAEMLANSKNYFQQNSINRNTALTKSTIQNIGGAFLSPISATTNQISSTIDYTKSIINENLTIDNLKNAPETLSNAKGNADFINSYSENGIVVEEYDILQHDKEIINDYMCMYGFSYNKIGNIKNFDNIRKYYNYIKADIEEVSSDTLNVSDNVLQKFKRLFAQGVRFWNTDTFSYTKENYEKWFDIVLYGNFYLNTPNAGPYNVIINGETILVNDHTTISLRAHGGTFNVDCGSMRAFTNFNIDTDGEYTVTNISYHEKEISYLNATRLNISTRTADYI